MNGCQIILVEVWIVYERDEKYMQICGYVCYEHDDRQYVMK